MKLEDLPNILSHDAFTLLCGQAIGSGVSRQVYECPINDMWVVKFEYAKGYFQNVYEYRIWERVNTHGRPPSCDIEKLQKWLAPVAHISDCGMWMLQRKTMPVTITELKRRLPKIPVWLTDTKADNWGKIGTRIVCHDYGTALVNDYGLSTRLKRADWY